MKTFHIGYISSIAVTPLLVCKHLGWFEQNDLHLVLSHQLGWQSLSSRLLSGGLDGAIVPPSMLIRMAANERSEKANCRGCFAVGCGGDALLARAPLHHFVDASREKGEIRYGTSYPDCPDSGLIREWMASSGMKGEGVRLSERPIPVTQSADLINEDFIDIYLSYQPWIKIGQKLGIGTPLDINIGRNRSGVTRVLALKEDFLRLNKGGFALSSSLLEKASDWIYDPNNSNELYEILEEEKWGLNKSEILDLFYPNEVASEAVAQFRFGHSGGTRVRLTTEDVETFWRFYCASQAEPIETDLPAPQWVFDIFCVE